ncbi:MAG TPA: HNH endonuclease [Planctomycetota bacterium]|nr:HNH endonuclease [Planctomycetota bacterium]
MSAVLEMPALVLNRGWVPIRTTSVRDAFCLMVRGAALAVEPESYRTHDFKSWAEIRASEHEPHVRTVSLRLRVPEVIVLSVYNKVPDRDVVFSRRNLFKRDRNRCQYCGARPGTPELTIDHIVPRSRGGTSTWTNCVLACVPCNARKADRTPAEAGLTIRTMPAKPAWKPHFTIRVGEYRQAWKDFLSDAYWNVELQE